MTSQHYNHKINVAEVIELQKYTERNSTYGMKIGRNLKPLISFRNGLFRQGL